MIHGVNFGAPDIPRDIRVRERRIKGIPVARGTVAVLVGACDTAEEKHQMTIQADNGRRSLHWEIIRGRHYVWAFTKE